jgi:hypothetical protein
MKKTDIHLVWAIRQLTEVVSWGLPGSDYVPGPEERAHFLDLARKCIEAALREEEAVPEKAAA